MRASAAFATRIGPNFKFRAPFLLHDHGRFGHLQIHLLASDIL